MLLADGQSDWVMGVMSLVLGAMGSMGAAYAVWSGSRDKSKSISAEIRLKDREFDAKEDERIANHLRMELNQVHSELSDIRKAERECREEQIRQKATNEQLTQAVDILQAELRANGVLHGSAVHKALPQTYVPGKSKEAEKPNPHDEEECL